MKGCHTQFLPRQRPTGAALAGRGRYRASPRQGVVTDLRLCRRLNDSPISAMLRTDRRDASRQMPLSRWSTVGSNSGARSPAASDRSSICRYCSLSSALNTLVRLPCAATHIVSLLRHVFCDTSAVSICWSCRNAAHRSRIGKWPAHTNRCSHASHPPIMW